MNFGYDAFYNRYNPYREFSVLYTTQAGYNIEDDRLYIIWLSFIILITPPNLIIKIHHGFEYEINEL